MAYVGFVKLIREITAICGKKPKIVFINSKKDIAVYKKMFYREDVFFMHVWIDLLKAVQKSLSKNPDSAIEYSNLILSTVS
jgi:hypothetical protein